MLKTRAKSRCLPDGWTAQQDEQLRKAAGRYSRIAALSDKWKIAETVLITRWHLVRAGLAGERPAAGLPIAKTPPRPKVAPVPKPKVEAPPGSFEAMMAAITPAMRDICDTLSKRGPTTMKDLTSSVGRCDAPIRAMILQNRERMAAHGWCIVTTVGRPKAYSLNELAGAVS